ncbi:hypothetical protein, partial [Megalodesulfovibrio gigas]
CAICGLDTSGPDAQLRAKVLRGIDAIAKELPKRHDWREVMTVGLDGGGDLSFLVQAPNFRAFPAGNYFGVSSIVPAWGYGWRSLFRDEKIYDILSWFLHYARQYIHRSNVARVLMIAWEEHSKILHPFGSRTVSLRYGPQRPMTSAQNALDVSMNALRPSSTIDHDFIFNSIPLSNSAWINRNMLDPYVHQAAFHCLRGHNLRHHSFDVEAVVAFDCAIQSVARLLRNGGKISRRQLCKALGLPSEAGSLAEYMYFLRNEFGAHAGGWRWWDAGEMVGENIEDIANLADEILAKAADAEVHMRAVEPDPVDWAGWFFQHFKMLWDTVWFENFDRWNAQHQ